ncbi:hypothetical protein [Brevibacillus porteri]|uniref:hypothetical protein n=1 Tax=Brevibacillus porteri TaxID=2126350 RepID=UPI003D1E2A2B
MAVCMIVVSGFGNQQTMTTSPTKKLVIIVFGSDPVNINSDGSSLQKLSSDWADNLNVVGDWLYV